MILPVIFFSVSLLAAPATTRVSERFGFDPADSTAQLQAALDSGLPEITVDRRDTPWVTRPLFVRSNQRIVFEKGVEVVAKRGAFAGKNDRLLALVAVTNVTLVGENAVLRMWAEDYADRKTYASSEHRHALGLYSCANVTIRVQKGQSPLYKEKLNIARLVRVRFAPVEADALRLVVTEAWGGKKAHVFAFDAL